MRVIEPFEITNAVLSASNVSEDDYPEWDSAIAYGVGNRVIVTGMAHRVYEAIVASTNVPPAADPTKWLEIGATNRWKAFDDRISDPVSKAGSITYSLTLGEYAAPGAVAFFGLLGSDVTVTITDAVEGVVYSETRGTVDDSVVFDWYSYFYEPVAIETEDIFAGLPLHAGSVVDIEIASSATAQVGQIVIGRDRELGVTLQGTEIGIEDFSSKDRDAFGNAMILERAFIQTARFNFAFPPGDARRVQQILARLRARPAVYYAGEDTTHFGTTVYGFYQDFNIPLTFGRSFATLEVEGLV